MSMPTMSKFDLSKKLTAIIMVVALLLGILLSTLHLVTDYFQQKKTLDATIEQLIAVSKPSVIEVAYKLDRDGADRIARGLLEYGFIVEVSILDEFENVLTRRTGNNEKQSTTLWLTKLISDEFTEQSVALNDMDLPNISYGTLNFIVNKDLALQPFYERSLSLFFLGILQYLLLAGIMLWVFYLLLTRPLIKLAKALANVDPEAADGVRIESVALHENDELGEISKAANQFLENNEDHLKRRQQADEEREALEQKLRQSQKMEAIGTLAGGIAHDFNNLLAIIIGFAEMAKDTIPESNPALKDVNEILNTSNRAKELVKQILAFSRKSVQKRTYLDIRSLVEQAMTMLRSSIPTNIDIQSDIDPKCGGVLADTSQIIQVILNLCTNAAQAMERDGGVLKVSLTSVAFLERGGKEQNMVSKGPYVRLTVSDTGIGIEENIQEKIFDPYFTTKEFGKGTGMGLAMVHGIVKSHGGKIDVHSKPGVGSTFNVFLPEAEAETEEK